jgi:methylase of polypeptide subunit release factors
MNPSFVERLPIRFGSKAEFEQVVSSLRQAGFDEQTIQGTLKIKTMSDVGSVKASDVDFTGVSAELQIFIRLFLFQRLVSRQEAENVLGRSTLEAFLALGLLGSYEFGDDQLYAQVLLYPVAGFLIASDRHSNPDGSSFQPPSDIVFPAIYAGTLRFLELLPKTPVDEALDLCAGSGIGAFVLSRHAKRAVCVDITERATQFALFNRQLNDLANTDAFCGDCYDAVAGQSFDCIVAHPPYVPSLDVAAIWRDGGLTGELLVRRIVEGMPKHLRPGGTFCLVTMGLDTDEGPFEARARAWLKDESQNFDVIFASTNERTPQEVLRELCERDANLGVDGAKLIEAAFAAAGVKKMPYGALVMRRHARAGERQPWTLRTTLSDETNGSDFEVAFALHQKLLDQKFLAELAHLRLRLAPRLQVIVTHVVHEGELVPAEHIFETDKPFAARGRIDGWMVPLFTRFDGERSARDIYEQAQANGELPDGFAFEHFAELAARMLERGFLALPF